ncbi:MAG TPA: D-alanyl-D-alanine carboxypeptidase family protein, partial [Tissierellaceae bacterium]
KKLHKSDIINYHRKAVNLLKRIFTFFLSIIILITPFSSFAEENLDAIDKQAEKVDNEKKVNDPSDNELGIFGEGAILMDSNSSQVLFEKNANKKLYPASTTKIMTAILAIELGNLDDVVTVDKEVTDLTSGSHIALDIGEQMTLKNLLYALLIESANDSALAIAKHISGDIDSFVDLMNKKAEELGAKNTNFVNPNGLHDDNHYSTPYDLALIAKYAMKNDTFRNIVKEYTYNIPPTNKKNEPRFLKSANRLIYSTQTIKVNGKDVPIKYDGAVGIKTGYTTMANSCLVSSVEQGNRSLIAVVLNSDSENIYVDTHKLYDYGFQQFTGHTLGFKNQFIDNFKIKNGLAPFVAGVLKEDLTYTVYSGAIDDIKTKVTPVKDLSAPIKKGSKIGEVSYLIDDKIITKANVVSTVDVPKDPSLVWYRRLLDKWYLIVFALFFIMRVNVMKKRAKIKKRKKIEQRRKNQKKNIKH